MANTPKVIIIGAGWSGLAAAKTYLEVAGLLKRPIDLTILDDAPNPGGAWSSTRIYPGLVANNLNGEYEYSDYSMVDEDHPALAPIPGDRVQSYLESYARRENILSKIRFETKVVKINRLGGQKTPAGWTVETNRGEKLECDKLIIATGLYSKPRIPALVHQQFSGRTIHSRDLGVSYPGLLADPGVKNIVVVGGCKSSIEAVSLFLPQTDTKSESDKHITWIVRPGDPGVPMVVLESDASPDIGTVAGTRLFGALQPSIFNTSGFWYTFIHTGRWLIGSLLLRLLFVLMSRDVVKGAKYYSSTNGKRIKPKTKNWFFLVHLISRMDSKHPFLKWLHKDNFDVLKVQRATPLVMSKRAVIVRNESGFEEEIRADAVIMCTGFQPSVDFFDAEEAKWIGIPVPLVEKSTQEKDGAISDSSLSAAIDTEVLHQFPYLRGSPEMSAQPLTESQMTKSTTKSELKLPMTTSRTSHLNPIPYPLHTPIRLHRQILPANSLDTKDRTLAFVGLVSSAQTTAMCEMTALWAVAWLEDLFQTPQTTSAIHISPSKILPISPNAITTAQSNAQIDRVTAFQRLRYGTKGARDPEMILDIQAFLDTLSGDLGLQGERKKAATANKAKKEKRKVTLREKVYDWFKEYLEPYRPGDYAGVIQEFLEARKERMVVYGN